LSKSFARSLRSSTPPTTCSEHAPRVRNCSTPNSFGASKQPRATIL